MPSAIMPTTVATGIRVPAMQGTPAMIFGSAEIRSNLTAPAYALASKSQSEFRSSPPAAMEAALIGAANRHSVPEIAA
ncbi:MAG: hypothetical protein ACT4PI_00580 [Actinomycetota bacterium]